MTIELPYDLAWVNEMYGNPWPAVDEDHLFDLARVWRRSAINVDLADKDTGSVARDVVETHGTLPIGAFKESIRRSHYNHRLVVQGHDLFGVTLHSVGLAVQSAKITMVGILALTATRVMHTKAKAIYIPGVAAEEGFHSVAAGRKAIETTLRRLHRFIDEEVGGNAHRELQSIFAQVKSVSPERPPN